MCSLEAGVLSDSCEAHRPPFDFKIKLDNSIILTANLVRRFCIATSKPSVNSSMLVLAADGFERDP